MSERHTVEITVVEKDAVAWKRAPVLTNFLSSYDGTASTRSRNDKIVWLPTFTKWLADVEAIGAESGDDLVQDRDRVGCQARRRVQGHTQGQFELRSPNVVPFAYRSSENGSSSQGFSPCTSIDAVSLPTPIILKP